MTEDFTLPFVVEDTAYRSYGDGLVEIAYTGLGQTAEYRQSVGSGDNSGDYTAYDDVVELKANDLSVTLKGDEGIYVLAVWGDGMFSYSMRLSQGFSETEWLDMLNLTQIVTQTTAGADGGIGAESPGKQPLPEKQH